MMKKTKTIINLHNNMQAMMCGGNCNAMKCQVLILRENLVEVLFLAQFLTYCVKLDVITPCCMQPGLCGTAN